MAEKQEYQHTSRKNLGWLDLELDPEGPGLTEPRLVRVANT